MARTLRPDADDLARLLRGSDLEPEFVRRIPEAVRAALVGNPRPLVRLRLARRGQGNNPDSISDANPTITTVTPCEEATLAWVTRRGPEQRAIEARAALDATPDAVFGAFDRPIPRRPRAADLPARRLQR